jgi:Fe-S oxidoreductase
MAGSWGLLARNADLSRRIASPMLDKLEAIHPLWGITDCPTCRLQMEQYSDTTIRHPVEIFHSAMKIIK